MDDHSEQPLPPGVLSMSNSSPILPTSNPAGHLPWSFQKTADSHYHVVNGNDTLFPVVPSIQHCAGTFHTSERESSEVILNALPSNMESVNGIKLQPQSANDLENAAQNAVLHEQEIATQKVIQSQREARAASGPKDNSDIISGRHDPNALKEHLLQMTTEHRMKMASKRGTATQPGEGIRDLKLHNKSMLQKWLWRFGQEETGCWKKVIIAKYGAQNNWHTKRITSPHGTGLWKHISTYQSEFFQNITFKVGNGAHVKFWKDRWLGNSSLTETYPALAQIACNKDSTIANNREGNSWNLLFRRNLQDWEFNEFINLLAAIEPVHTIELQSDKMAWGSSRRGIYTVKAGYNHLCSQNEVIENWPWKHIWRTKLPTKVICFTWTALNNACLTQDNLMRRNIQLVNRCYMCQLNLESISHLFLHCTVAAELWNFFCSIFGLSWVMPHSIKEAYECWNLCRVDKAIKRIWKMIPGTIFWHLWNERNRRCFDGISTPTHILKARCLVSLFSWHFLTPVNCPYNFLDFVSTLVIA